MKSKSDSTTQFLPKFDDKGLIIAIAQDASSQSILMVAYMNEEALNLTLSTGIAHYWSRSRAGLWKKGETSGNFQRVLEMRIDCDQDAILMKVTVEGDGNSCHTGRESCFYRSILTKDGNSTLVFDQG
ncbi:MAG: phosphoribosyl-AMP cyclohydrolase [Notoacmeibacter sp.]